MKAYIYKRRFFFIPVFIIAGVSLVGFVIMQLWNNLLPDIFHVGTITFWQALGLFVLSKILFGFGGGGPMRRRGGIGDRFRNMNDEEKAKFKAEMKDRCGWGRKSADLDPKPESM